MSNPNVSIFSPDKLIKDLPRVSKYIGIDRHGLAADIKKDFLKAPIDPKSYDTLLCTQVLEHTPEPQAFLDKINLVLKRGGVLILTVPFTGYLHEVPNDYYRYTRFGLRYMLQKSNFKIIYIKNEGNWISSIGQEIISYLEPTFNRFLLKYPKRLLQFSILLLIKALSRLPERFTKSKYSTINYIVVARKQ